MGLQSSRDFPKTPPLERAREDSLVDVGGREPMQAPNTRCAQKLDKTLPPRPDGRLPRLCLTVESDRETRLPARACRRRLSGNIAHERCPGPGVLLDSSHADNAGRVANVRPLHFGHPGELGQHLVAVFAGAASAAARPKGLSEEYLTQGLPRRLIATTQPR